MNTIAANDAAHNEVQQLHDRWQAILALRDAEQDMVIYRQLDHAQWAAFREWLFAMQAATMRSDPDSYYDDQKLS